MRELYVIYDGRCGLCSEIKGWLLRQRTYVTLRLVAAGSPQAREVYPALPPGELAVVSDQGQVWLGDNAMVMCLWALRDYRRWARRLASPGLRPMARAALAAVSRNRDWLSEFFGWRSEAALRERLEREVIPPCPLP